MASAKEAARQVELKQLHMEQLVVFNDKQDMKDAEAITVHTVTTGCGNNDSRITATCANLINDNHGGDAIAVARETNYELTADSDADVVEALYDQGFPKVVATDITEQTTKSNAISLLLL